MLCAGGPKNNNNNKKKKNAFLFQRLFVVIQRVSAILLYDSFESADNLG